MASIKDTNKNIYSISPNIIISMDDNNMGEMYIYDDEYSYALNGITASGLIDYFAYNDDLYLSEEIIDVIMDITINTGTH